MTKWIKYTLLAVGMSMAADSGLVKINYIRPETGNARVYFELKTIQLGTTVFRLDPTGPVGREMSSALFLAFSTGKNIKISANCTTCGWGTDITSIYVFDQ
jgi:hypothetical protein